MMFISKSSRLLALTLAVLAGGFGVARAAESTTTKPADPKQSAAAAKEKARQATSLPDLLKQLGDRREEMIKDHELLQKQLKEATDAQKKAILERMEQQRKAFEEVTSALQRQIADERRKQRQGALPKR